jgi:hypothetical protein
MTLRRAFAVAVAASALSAWPAAAAPDLPQMGVALTDLPSGTSIVSEDSFSLGDGAREYDRLFRLRPSSGFVRLNSSVVLNKRSHDAELLEFGARLVLSDKAGGRSYAKFAAGELGLKARRVQIGKAKPLRVGDGGAFTVTIRVNRKTPIVIGVFRVDRAVGEIDARGTSAHGLLSRTRRVLRIAATRIRQGLAPHSLTEPTITGTPQVGIALQASPGTWSDATSLTYAWQRCDTAGMCTAIPGATGQAYTVGSADSGFTLAVVVTAANGVGQTSVASAPTAPVP